MSETHYILHVQPDTISLNDAASKFWILLAEKSIQQRDAFYVALTGGSTPKELYRQLASKELSGRIDWQKVHVFIGDERFVPLEHPDSNFGMAKSLLLDEIDIPESNLHPVDILASSPEVAANRYEAEINKIIPKSQNGNPQFDLVMLGMGDDGHTASLFPDTDILEESTKNVSSVYVKKLESWRVSLCYPCINNARQIMFLVSGKNKSKVLAHVLSGDSEIIYPVQRVRAIEQTHWFLDETAVEYIQSS